ncbi:MAG: dTMP kinase [Thaumarchaeota archaeon]|nr:dTMP kinase [Nitrososphaerota archaeon]|tara:strand:- start:2825 stop:3436 length:612 start_codon:yes stop_codon:yes gene_type:complete
MQLLRKGKFIVIEGIDQSGKKTQSILLRNRLKKKGYKVGYISFPKYNTSIGKLVKKCLHDDSFSLEMSHILLSANRWESEKEIRYKLENMDFVVCNRYCDSNIAYGLANGLKKEWLENLDLGLPKSDLTILIDIPIIESVLRKSENRDRYEKDRKFLNNVKSRYKKLATMNKWSRIKGNKSKEEVSKEIWNLIVNKYKIKDVN